MFPMASVLQELMLIQKIGNEKISGFFFIEVMVLKFTCENAREIAFIFCIAEGDGSGEIAEISCNSCFD